MRGLNAIVVAAVATIAVLLAAPGSLAAETVEAGPLRAVVDADAWRMTFTDAGGRTVLAEDPSTGSGPAGTLGFRTQSGWRHATRVVEARRDGPAYLARVATTDPLGRRLAVRIEPASDGVIRVTARVVGDTSDVTALGVGFGAVPGERFLGFGERSNAVDQRGNTVETFVSDGPYLPEERPFIGAAVPAAGYRQRDDATYFPIPWLLSSRGHGVLLDNTETAYHRLDGADSWSLEVTGAPEGHTAGAPAPERLAFRVFAGPRPADALRRFTRDTGRQPASTAPWFFGAWFQPTGPDEARADQVRRLRDEDTATSVAQTYTHYLPCGDQRGRRDREAARTASFHDAGYAVTTYFNPMICTDYDPPFSEAVRREALTKTALGQPYLYRYTGSEQFLVGQFDFSSAAGNDVFHGILREAVEDGHDGWMEDFGEYTPLDSRSANGMDGSQMHNLYPTQYHCSSYRFTSGEQPRPLAGFVRSGFTHTAACARMVWGGDPTTTFGYDGLESALRQGLTMGLSGVSTWGSDIGGYFSIGTNRRSPELLKRWVQLGLVSGVMRTQAEGFQLPAQANRPQVFDEDQIAHWRRYAKLRTQLYPYVLAAETEYRLRGLPIMRHMALAYPSDPAAAARDDQLLFGPDLLAAPVVTQGATERAAYLPAGRWVDLWRSASYVGTTGGLRLGRARMLRGGTEAKLPAPLEELPLLVRAGALLALLPPDVDTLADYGRDPSIVNLHDRLGRMQLLLFPRGRTRSRFNRRERLYSTDLRDRWVLRVRGERRRLYDMQASLGTLTRRWHVCRVELDGRPLRRRAWRYDRRSRVLRASFRTQSGRLTARRCGS